MSNQINGNEPKKKTAKEIAEIFRGSVKHDFKKTPIISASIFENRKTNSDFFTLLDREAFEALLEDYISYDNQLVDLFLDLYDFNAGILKFADQDSRQSAKGTIKFFLEGKYAYHKTDIAKVYLAVNTWLIFYGDRPITVEWEECPFCGGKMSKTKCSNKACGKTVDEINKAEDELYNSLLLENSGKETVKPAYWSFIKPNTAFDKLYKSQLNTFYTKRELEKEAELKKSNQRFVDLGLEGLKEARVLLLKEDSSERPDYDAVLIKLNEDKRVIDAIKTGDGVFNKQYDSLKIEIIKKKTEYEKIKDISNRKQALDDASKEFLDQYTKLNVEEGAPTLDTAELRELYNSTRDNYQKIMALESKNIAITDNILLEALKDFKKRLSVEINDSLLTREREESLLAAQADLINEVNTITTKLEGLKPEDGLTYQVNEEFIRVIEKNKMYDEYRFYKKNAYLELVKPIRESIKRLTALERKVKLDQFMKEAELIITAINAAEPKKHKHKTLSAQYENMLNGDFYKIVSDNADFRAKNNTIKELLLNLEHAEEEYDERMEHKHWVRKRVSGIFLKVFLTLFILAGLAIGGLFVAELGGYLKDKTILLNDIDRNLVIDNSENKTLNEYLGSEENYIIPESCRSPWELKDSPILAIGNNAFNNNMNLKSIVIPGSIAYIGDYAFNECRELKRVDLKGEEVVKITPTSFKNTYPVFYVNENAYDAYMKDESWKVFRDFIFPDVDNSLTEVSLIFDSNGGNEIKPINKHRINTICRNLPVPLKPGYAFMGWEFNFQNEHKDILGKDQLITSSLKLKAKWDLADFNIKFDYNGGAPEDGITRSRSVKYLSTVNMLPRGIKAGYTFTGWTYNDLLVKDEFEYKYQNDITLAAKWEANAYLVEFDYGSGSGDISNKNVTFDDKYYTLPEAFKEGYRFLGWYDENDVKIEENTILKRSEGHTLHAKYEEIAYNIIFDAKGGKYGLESKELSYETPIILDTPTKVGYQFVAWVDSKGNQYSAGTSLSRLTSVDHSDFILSAIWSEAVNSIKYDSNGGYGTMEETSIKTDSTVTLRDCTFMRDGYTFMGWSSSPIGEVEYQDKAEIKVGSIRETVLYAIWSANEYKITIYNIKDSTSSHDIKVINSKMDEEVILPKDIFTRDGYTLMGFGKADDIVVDYMPDYLYKTPDHNTTLYVVWVPNTYTLTLADPMGGGEAKEISIKADEVIVLPAVHFVRKGYRFTGWSLNDSLEIDYLDRASYTGGYDNQILNANWEIINYNITYDLDGGTNSKLNIDSFNINDRFSFNPATKDGYIFKGWYLDSAKSKEIKEIAAGEIDYNLKLYAHFDGKPHTITFMPEGGSGSMDITNTKTGSSFTMPKAQFNKPGYSFKSWLDKNTLKHYLPGDKLVIEDYDLALHAEWELITYTITYHLNGGENSLDNIETYNVETPTFTFKNAARDKYYFVGWYSDLELLTPYNEIALGTTGNIDLYAKFEANKHTITFDCNGGSGAMNLINTNSITDTKLSKNLFTRTGYKFTGWALNPDGDILYLDEATVPAVDSDLVLYAKWELIDYNIIYHLDKGINDKDNPAKFNILTPTIILNEATRAGYTFTGWYSDSNLSNVITEITLGTSKEINLYAKWTANTNEITLHSNNGSEEVVVLTGKTDSIITLPDNTYIKPGYTFIGWREGISESAGSQYYNKDNYLVKPEAKQSLYAVWKENTYQISYELNGGTNSSSNPHTFTTTTEVILSNPVRAGYTFAGWYSDSGFINVVEKINKNTTDNVKLYAKWTAISSDVIIDFNGGNGDISQFSAKTGESVTLPANGYTKEGYKMAGYALSASGSIEYSLGASFIMPGKSITLYVVWVQTSFKINYYLNGGINNPLNPSGFNTETSYFRVAKPTKEGYTFESWYLDEGFNTAVDIISGSDYSADINLYAKFNANSYTLTFNSNGGGDFPSRAITYDSSYNTLPTPQRTGYRFIGWFLGDSKIVESTICKHTADHELVARYEIINYNVSFNPSGGTPQPNSVIMHYGDEFTNLPVINKTGYDFLGWYLGDVKVNNGDVFKEAKDSILVARFKAQTYNLTYNTVGGNSLSGKTVTYDSAYGALPTPVKSRHRFLGWTLDGKGIDSNTICKKVGNQTLVACWMSQYSYTVSGGNCTVTVKNTATGATIAPNELIDKGTVVNITAAANSGYDLSSCTPQGDYRVDGNFVITVSATKHQSGNSCVLDGTGVLMADGTERNVSSIKIGDMIMSFNHNTGLVEAKEVIYIFHYHEVTSVLDLTFSNGSKLSVVNGGHGMFDATLGEYVLVDKYTVARFYHHEFLFILDGKATTVRLVDYNESEYLNDRYDIITEDNFNTILNGLIGVSDAFYHICNIVEYNADFTVNMDVFQKDLDNYGLLNYDDWAQYVSYEEFNMYAGKYYSIGLGKGIFNMDYLYKLIELLNDPNGQKK